MGLFGGFKAKFTRNNTTKVKPQDVVCLKYHIHSEFDQQDRQESSLPVQNNPNIKKNEVIKNRTKTKSRKELAKSAIFPESDTDYSALSTPKMSQKSLSLTNLNGEVSKIMQRNENRHQEPSDSITISTTVEMPSNGQSIAISDTKFARTVEQRDGVLAENVAIVTNNHLLSTNNNTKTEKREKPILKSFSTQDESSDDADADETDTYLFLTKRKPKTEKPIPNHNGQKNLDNEQSTLIFMTQTSTTDSERNFEDDFNFSFTQTLQSFNASRMQDSFDRPNEDNFAISNGREEDFKVNVVHHDLDRTYSYSEEEPSFHEDEPPVFTRMGYSSQAASIFFGEDVEPEIVRPRRILFTGDDDERRSSGADC